MGIFSFFLHHNENKNDKDEQEQSLDSITIQPSFSIKNRGENTGNDYSQDNPILEEGLSYGDILMLNWLNGQKVNKKIPGYFVESFQINPLASKQEYKKKGLLINGSSKSRLQALKIPQLKAILKENNQKISGRKAELINRIQQNIDASKYIDNLPKTFGLSDKALLLLKKYKLLVWASNNEHILSPKNYIPFIASNKKEQVIAINLLEDYITKLIKQHKPFIAYPLSNAETEIATFYKSLDNKNDYIKHSVYSILIDYLCVSEINDDEYTEPYDFNTQYIQTHIIDYLQDQDVNESLINSIVISFTQRYSNLLTTSFEANPEIGTKAIMDALVLQPNEYHKKRLAALRKLRRNN